MRNNKKLATIIAISILVSMILTPTIFVSKLAERNRTEKSTKGYTNYGTNYAKEYEYINTFKIYDQVIEDKIIFIPIWNAGLEVGFKKYEEKGPIYFYRPVYALLIIEELFIVAFLYLIFNRNESK